MRGNYTLNPMRGGQVVQALAFLRAFGPEISVERWQVIVEQGYATMVVTDGAGYIRGLTFSLVRMHPIAHKLLDVPILIVGSVTNEKAIAESLFLEAKRRAIVQRCDFIRIWTWSPDVLDRLDDLSFCNRWDHGLMHCLKPAPIQSLGD
ncbi:hypothetical protein HGP16_28205 [Rhizobium sp. P40RR-XXII]|uniref:hypothetical protein n=1 Tax=Rhizobium sp. P40RR-XXII TaxID=2726739 RepID=UPI001456BD3E|nr:hypothetical protein [Rhizobium sp. P40RR-XXII]NLS20417.1 hypothetical protein [Rhizobium sp. P40RR-XXII]